ncbi:MAG: outer membrane beta-barrel domain-containing protein [Proteobacteria bacterium]|nr:outer membrane beta-barrel domain-containing protein [Pseudomonadota bacterium]
MSLQLNLNRILIMSALILGHQEVLAIDLKPEEIRGKSSQSPVTILQNRYFTKALRPELGISYGTITNEAYTDTSLLAVRGALFFNEWIGIEFQSLKTKVSDSDDRKALRDKCYLITCYRQNPDGSTVPFIVDPEVNTIKKISDLNTIIAPFYGKLNFSDWLIIYSDVYFIAGISRMNTDQGNLNALTYGAGQRFYWAKALSMRLDFRARTYTETRNEQDYRKNTYSIDVGLSYFLL